MAWDYAELSKMAKESGGPEKLVELLVESGKKEVLPWVGVAFAGGVALTACVQKAIKYFSEKSKISAAEVAAAKQELIQGIKDYDASQEMSAAELLESNNDDNGKVGEEQ